MTYDEILRGHEKGKHRVAIASDGRDRIAIERERLQARQNAKAAHLVSRADEVGGQVKMFQRQKLLQTGGILDAVVAEVQRAHISEHFEEARHGRDGVEAEIDAIEVGTAAEVLDTQDDIVGQIETLECR